MTFCKVIALWFLLRLHACAHQELNFESARYQPKFPKPRK
jgi:hypothetical protein